MDLADVEKLDSLDRQISRKLLLSEANYTHLLRYGSQVG